MPQHAAAAPARAPQIRPPAAPARHVRPASRLEVVRPQRQLRSGPTFALGVVLAFAIAIAVVACQVALVQGQQQLDDLNAEITASTDEYHQLRLEVAQLEAPSRIVEAATTNLGMVPPPEITYLTPSGAVTVPGAADPAARPDRLAEHADTRPHLEGGG